MTIEWALAEHPPSAHGSLRGFTSREINMFNFNIFTTISALYYAICRLVSIREINIVVIFLYHILAAKRFFLRYLFNSNTIESRKVKYNNNARVPYGFP